MYKISKKELNNMKKKVKEKTGYNLNQIEIVSFCNNCIDYNIYKNYENDFRLGRKPIDSGSISKNDDVLIF